MYAIIRAGGHQEKVAAGEQITVDLLKQRPGEEVRFRALLIAKDDGTVVSDPKVIEADGAVVGKVIEHLRGKKVEYFDYRQKTGYRRHGGHRQPLTLVEIAEIRLGDVADTAEAAAKRAADAAAKETEAKAEEPPAVKKAAPKKPAAKKGTPKKPAAKKAAPKKPAAKKGTPKK